MSDIETASPEAEASGHPASTGRGRPLLATLIASLLLILAASYGSAGALPSEPAARLAYIIGALFASLVLFWFIPYLVTIRKASRGWKIGSFVAIALLSLVVVMAKFGAAQRQADEAMRRDLQQAARQMSVQLDGAAAGPVQADANSGPLTRMTAAFLNGVMADRSAWEDEARSAGMTQIIGVEGLTEASPALRNCERILRLSESADRYSRRVGQHLGAARRVGREAVAKGELRPSDLDDFFEGAERGLPLYREMWASQARLGAETGALCRLMSQSQWETAGNEILFRNEADRLQAAPHFERIRAEILTLQRIQERSRQTAKQAMNM